MDLFVRTWDVLALPYEALYSVCSAYRVENAAAGAEAAPIRNGPGSLCLSCTYSNGVGNKKHFIFRRKGEITEEIVILDPLFAKEYGNR